MLYDITIEEKTDEPKYDEVYTYILEHEETYTRKEIILQFKKVKEEILKTKKVVERENFIKTLKKLFGYTEAKIIQKFHLYEYEEYSKEDEKSYCDLTFELDQRIDELNE